MKMCSYIRKIEERREIGEEFSDFNIYFGCCNNTVRLACGDYLCIEGALNGKHANGLCYRRLQSVFEDDTDGAYISNNNFKGE